MPMTYRSLLCALLVLLLPLPAGAQEKLRVGVAANYILPFKELAAAFEKKTGIDIQPTFASTGSLHAQISAGAPYDLFLAADEKRPASLYRRNLCGEPFIYATGRLVLWSPRREACRAGTWQGALLKEREGKVAIPHPDTAAYGEAACLVLKRAALWVDVQPHLVYGQDVAQAFQYAAVKGTALAFLSKSFALSAEGLRGCHYPIAEAPPVRQAACVLQATGRRAGANTFAAFLRSPEAVAVGRKYGYE